MTVRLLLILLLLFGLDLYVFQGVKVLMHQKSDTTQRLVFLIYWLITVFAFGIILTGQWIDWHSWPKRFRTYSFSFVFVIYFSKLFVVVFMLLDDIVRLFRWIAAFISTRFSNPGDSGTTPGLPRVSRLNFLVQLGFIIGSIPFFAMIYGMMGGAYRYQVRRLNLSFPNLPKSFDKLKVVQISDLHTGSFMSREPVEKAIRMVMDEKPDLILFTGDLVNDRYNEAVEYADILSSCKAPMGVYSILGNHDYGDYYRWNTMEEKAKNLDQLKKFHGELGWKLLLNEHLKLERNGEEIGLIGVENWSAHRAFHKYGDMHKATAGMQAASFNILMSHDPSHWHAEVTDKFKFVDLTLSGHTHGFQFGVEIPGFRWSPVQYMYKEWADLYQKENQYLYVNRGLGFLAYPGRVGILPEITVFNLHSS